MGFLSSKKSLGSVRREIRGLPPEDQDRGSGMSENPERLFVTVLPSRLGLGVLRTLIELAGVPDESAEGTEAALCASMGYACRMAQETEVRDRGSRRRARPPDSFPPRLGNPGGGHVALRVVGAGLGRTGTASLKQALEFLLEGPCYHSVRGVSATAGHARMARRGARRANRLGCAPGELLGQRRLAGVRVLARASRRPTPMP